MLKIRREQMQTFSADMAERFEDKLVARVKEHFPSDYVEQGEEHVRQNIRAGAALANDYGIHTERDVARFVLLLYELGPDFDVDPRHPWAADVLARKGTSGTKKMNLLCDLAADEAGARRLE